jgi:type VI secretion system protein ImpA
MFDESPLPIDELLAPLSGDSAVGANLRTDDSIDPALREVRDLAKDAISAEKSAQNTGGDFAAAGLTHWRTATENCQRILREQSKDLEVGAILVEAEIRTGGLEGLASGLDLVAQLAERYWSDIFARAKAAVGEPDDEAIVGELLSRLNKWNDALPRPIAWIPLTAGGDAGDYALWQYEQASQADKDNQSPEERERRKTITIDQFSRSVRATHSSRPNDLPQLLGNLDRATAAANRLEEVFQNLLPSELASQAPSLGRVRERLEDIQRCLQHTAKDLIDAIRNPPTTSAEGVAGAAGTTAAAPAGQLINREQAFRELSKIADFFARTEPLSLLAEQIRLIVHRGQLSPENYYKDLIDSNETRRQFFRLVGIKPSENDDSS